MAPHRSSSRGSPPRQDAGPEFTGPGDTSPKPPSRQSYRGRFHHLWGGPYPYLAILSGVLVVVIVIIIVANHGGGPRRAGNVKDAITQVTHVDGSIYDKVGTGVLKYSQLTSGRLPIVPTTNPVDVTGPGGKPEILYMGGEYCPYCAAERWVMLAALSRFGTFKGVAPMFSSWSDIYPNTPTFTFLHASYESQYVDFVPVEMYSRTEPASGAPNLQQPTAQEQQLMTTYDSSGGIPFLLVGGRYVGGTPFIPAALADKSQQQVASALSDPSEPSTQDIIGNANLLSAAICKLTGSQPTRVCQSSGVEAATKLLG
jgi:thiol-disulfide isomerase/thioredoxin